MKSIEKIIISLSIIGSLFYISFCVFEIFDVMQNTETYKECMVLMKVQIIGSLRMY